MGKGPGDGPMFGRRGRGEPLRIVPITSDAGMESFTPFSPDASQVAYTTWDGGTDGNTSLYVKVIDGGASPRLTESSGIDSSSAWSTDGRHIAFLRYERGEPGGLYLLTISTGEPRRVPEDEARIVGIVWSSDDASIIFSSERNGQGGLWCVPARGRLVFSLPGAGEGARLPAISADGTKLTCTRAMRDLNIWRLGLETEAQPEPLIRSTRLACGSGLQVV